MKSVYLKQLAVGPMQNFAYLIGAADARECLAIDPGWEADAILAAASGDGRAICAIALTHGHFDHVGGVKELLSRAQVPVFVHRGDAEALGNVCRPQSLDDGAMIDAGGMPLRCLHTPGHTPGSQCLLAEGNLFTGDTLFIDCCGRTDLEGSDPQAMHRSLRLLAALPQSTMVWPGHDYGPMRSAAMSEVLRLNPFLTAETLAAFLRQQG